MDDHRVEGALAALAEAYGVACVYEDYRHEPVAVTETGVRSALAAMGVHAGDEAEAGAALAEAATRAWRSLLPPTVVTSVGARRTVAAHAHAGAPVTARIVLEDGTVRTLSPPAGVEEVRRVDGAEVGRMSLPLPSDLPAGYHRLLAGADGREAEALLVVAPPRCPLPERRGWGWMVQLYATRSRASWGIGDLGDLASLGRWGGRLGADFLLVNPLHAAAPVLPQEPSPYFPSSRRFANPLYLRVTDVPELAALPAADRERVAAMAAGCRALNDTDRIDRDRVFQAKMAALALLSAAPLVPGRAAAFAAYRDAEGHGLVDFATYCALAERHGGSWRGWPAELRHPAGAAVAVARGDLADRVEFHIWLQWLCDTQLAEAQSSAVEAGMALGIVHDLAVGVNPGGADAWALQDDLATDVTVGAPPDEFNQQGQDWRLPPLLPNRLAASGYAPFRQMVASVLRHAGGIRIDHIMGLFRLWWIPQGASPAAGTYVRYPAEDLLGILALEAARAGGGAGAVVVGEDLGTVEDAVRDALAERRVLGNRVIWFERTRARDRRLRSDEYPELVLTAVTTHDLPTAAGFWTSEALRVQTDLGLLGDATSPEAQQRRVDAELVELVELLRDEGVLGDEPTEEDFVRAVHAFVARTPSLLVAAGLGDALGDRRQPNMPGTTDEYPNWRLPLSDPRTGRPILLDDAVADPRVLGIAQLLGSRRTPPR